MIRIYKTYEDQTRLIEKPEPGCWIRMTAPIDPELVSISRRYGIDLDDLRAALDEEERAHITVEDEYTLILVDIPSTEERNGKHRYVTIPLGILLTDEALITVCLEDTPVLDFFKDRRKEGRLATHQKTRLVLQILYSNASRYLQCLRLIDRQSGEIEQRLHESSRNRELIELMELEKSLVYFSTSLRSNGAVLEKLTRTQRIRRFPADEDLLEDVIIENRQALEMAHIYSGILSGTRDAYASIISNNLNGVMKFLAIVTIVLSVPTMIFSAYGMNINGASMPLSTHPYAFWLLLGISIALSGVVAYYFSKKKMY